MPTENLHRPNQLDLVCYESRINMSNILIVGATSAIAESTAKLWAKDGHRLYLLGRKTDRLASIVADLKVRGAKSVQFEQMEANDFAQHESIIKAASLAMGCIDIVLLAYGTLSDQTACEQDFEATMQELNTNAISYISMLTHLANYFEAQGNGSIVVISSVAGDRGRKSNYVYGAAKGAVTIFLQGLRQRMYKSGVQVLTIKPGFVDTPMTVKFKKGIIWVEPLSVAKIIYSSVKKNRNVVYAPWFWLVVMTVIKAIPESIFKKLKL